MEKKENTKASSCRKTILKAIEYLAAILILASITYCVFTMYRNEEPLKHITE